VSEWFAQSPALWSHVSSLGPDDRRRRRRLHVLIPLLVGLVGWTAVLPAFLHSIDGGTERVSVADLASGRRLSSRNVVVSGRAAVEYSGVREGSDRILIPVVPEGWTPTQPVRLAVQATGDYAVLLPELQRAPHFRGMLRTILWEGPTRAQRSFLQDQMKLVLADDLMVLELGGSPRGERLQGIFLPIVLLLVASLASLGLYGRTST
jgi:hypothetical protein